MVVSEIELLELEIEEIQHKIIFHEDKIRYSTFHLKKWKGKKKELENKLKKIKKILGD